MPRPHENAHHQPDPPASRFGCVFVFAWNQRSGHANKTTLKVPVFFSSTRFVAATTATRQPQPGPSATRSRLPQPLAVADLQLRRIYFCAPLGVGRTQACDGAVLQDLRCAGTSGTRRSCKPAAVVALLSFRSLLGPAFRGGTHEPCGTRVPGGAGFKQQYSTIPCITDLGLVFVCTVSAPRLCQPSALLGQPLLRV